jgi:hypothetical protein
MGDGPIARSRPKRLRPFITVGAAVVLGAGAAIGATAANASTTLASRLAAQYRPRPHLPGRPPSHGIFGIARGSIA